MAQVAAAYEGWKVYGMAKTAIPVGVLAITLGTGIALLAISLDGTIDDENTKTDLIIAGSVLLVVFLIGAYLFYRYRLKSSKAGKITGIFHSFLSIFGLGSKKAKAAVSQAKAAVSQAKAAVSQKVNAAASQVNAAASQAVSNTQTAPPAKTGS